MAEVPYTGLPSVAPREAPPDDYQHVDVKPEQFGGAIAKGVQQAGKGAEDLGNDFFKTAEFKDKIGSDDQINGFIANKNKLLYGDPSAHTQGPDGQPTPDTGFLGLEGRAASDHREDMLKQLEDVRKKGLENLKSPQARLLYDEQTRRMMADTAAHINSHTDQQWKVYAEGTNHAGATLALGDYVRSVGSSDTEGAKNYAADYVQQKIQAAQIKYGFDPKIEKAAEQGARYDLLKAQVDYVGTKDPVGALKILDQPDNKAIAGIHYDDMHRRLRLQATNATGEAAANDAVAKATQKGVGPVGTLTPLTSSFLRQRSGDARIEGVNPVFADRLVQAASDFERDNPGKLARFDSLNRTREEQARLYDIHLKGGPLAAPPGQSRHEYGLAADVPDGAFLNWLHEKVRTEPGKYGLEFLKGKDFFSDSGHVQLAGGGVQAGGTAPGQPQPQGGATQPQPGTAAQQPAIQGGGAMPMPALAAFQGSPQPFVEAPGGVVTVAPPHVRMPVAETETPTLRMQMASALRDAMDNPNLNDDERRIAEAHIEQKFRVMNLAEEQKAEKAKAIALDTADKYFQAIRATKQSSSPDYVGLDKQITGDTRLDLATRKELTRILDDESGGRFDKTLGEGYFPIWQAVNLPDDDPNKIVDMRQVLPMVRPGGRGSITPEGYNRIDRAMKEQQTAAGRSFAAAEKDFLKSARSEITASFGEEDTEKSFRTFDPKGDARWLKFMVAYEDTKRHLLDEAKAKHVAPFQALANLYDPDSKDYIGKLIDIYRPTEAEALANRVKAVGDAHPSWLAGRMQALGTLDAAARAQLATPTELPVEAGSIKNYKELTAAVQAGKIRGAEANRIGRERGWIIPAPPPGPQVPPRPVSELTPVATPASVTVAQPVSQPQPAPQAAVRPVQVKPGLEAALARTAAGQTEPETKTPESQGLGRWKKTGNRYEPEKPK